MENYLTAKQVARKLQVKTKKIYEYIKAGKLVAHRLGGNGNPKSKRHWRIKESDLDNFITGGHNAGSTQSKKSQNNNIDSLDLPVEPAVRGGL